jgi:nucleotide-binding universal stress UspA family protein
MAFRNILVPVDIEDTADHALDQAVSLARALGATITVLHVYGMPVYNYQDASFVPSPEVSESIKRAAREHLDAFLAKRPAEGFAWSPMVREGRIADEICKSDAEIGADLIVMGTHGRGLIGRTILGSVAEAVVRQSPIPVMTVRTT